ncbi:MAG: class I SAM-dependent RNA methyltransferase [Planctomycetota bacterium]|nr:class I SAM-dependent RNA methyltransferase [Planctomycetota bacterium]MDA1214114.1 class I SAM-dependent RNA methyltransferase [Planctomycetota bacterium]
MQLIATCPFGLEAVVGRELAVLGYTDQKTEDGRILFEADELAIARTNLWLRSADRVSICLGRFSATDFGELFDQTRELPWAEWLPQDATFPVRGKSVRSQLHSVPDCQAIVKKAIVSALQDRYHLDRFPETGPEFAIEVSLLKDIATITLDTTGVGLHKRGYRTWVGAAPLKETLAAALVQLSYWNRDRHLWDPCCGSGTIPIEAAMIGRNMAPGLKRKFAAEHWSTTVAKHWKEARDEAKDLMKPPGSGEILGSDIDAEIIPKARRHAEQAGVADEIVFEHRAIEASKPRHPYGVMITNPPYGERMGDESAAEQLYRRIGEMFAANETWSWYVLTAHSGFEHLVSHRATRRRKLYNGRIECTYYQYAGPRPPKVES